MTDTSNESHNTRDGLPKLEDDGQVNNYGEWKTKAELQLRSWDLLKYVCGPDSTPPDVPDLREPFIQRGTDPADPSGTVKVFRVHGNAAERDQAIEDAKPWMKQNNTALSKIVNAVPKDQMHLVNDTLYARDAWSNLRDYYQPLNSMLAEALIGDIRAYRCTPTMDVGAWLNDLQRLYNNLNDMDPSAITDRAFALIAIGNLPLKDPDWRSFAVGLRQRINQYDAVRPKPTPIRSKEFTSAIREEHIFRNRDNPDVQAHIFTARTNDSSKRKQDQSDPQPSKRARQNNQVTCTNSNCGRKGHTYANCLTYGGGNVGGYTEQWRGPWNLHLPLSQRTVANNVRPSTFASSSKPSAARANTCQTTSTPSPPHNSTDSDSEQSERVVKQEIPSFAFVTRVCNSPVVTTLPVFGQETPKNHTCFYDSGANRHVFNDRSAFETYRAIKPIPVKGFGDDYSTSAVGSGSVRVHAKYYGRVSSLLFTSVLHIPAARSNLISGVELDNAGVIATLGHGRATLSYSGTNLISGQIQDGMYRLDVTVVPSSSSIAKTSSPVAHVAIDANSPHSDFHTA